MVALRSRVVRGEAQPCGGVCLEVADAAAGAGAPATRLRARALVNAAGLGAQALAGCIAGVPPASIPPLHLARGCYFALAGSSAPSPFSRLVYPLPQEGGLGVHATLDLAGTVRFGPDVEWVPAVDYTVSPERAPAFEAAIRAYWPGLPPGSLQPAYAGIRPKARSGPAHACDALQYCS